MRHGSRRRPPPPPSFSTQLRSLVSLVRKYRPKIWIEFKERCSRKLHRPIRLPAPRKRALTPPLPPLSRKKRVLGRSVNSEQQTADQKPSTFLSSVPLKIRLKIYEYVFFSRGNTSQIIFLFDGKCERPVHFRCRDPERCNWDDNCWTHLSLERNSTLRESYLVLKRPSKETPLSLISSCRKMEVPLLNSVSSD
jgi:hypothetical protein